MLDACSDPESAVPDEALAACARDGGRNAFAVLVARHQDRVYRLALRMSGSTSDAEDIAQEAFLLALRGIGSFRGESRFRTWLYRIVVNQVLMQRRAAQRQPVAWLEASSLPGGAGPVVDGPSPEDAEHLVDRKRLVQRLREALIQLDESHRAALVLRDLEELSSEEAGEILGVSPAVVRQRAHRARLKVREQLGNARGSAACAERARCHSTRPERKVALAGGGARSCNGSPPSASASRS
jgi:RNA polymerase sigma-70 factor (ECF subfamily)